MKRRLAYALIALLMVTGCSAPPPVVPEDPEPAPPPVERPQPQPPANQPPGGPLVTPAHGGLLVQAVQAEYLWYLGGTRLAVANHEGLWSVRTDGKGTESLAPPGPNRLLIAPFADGLLYLDRHPEAVVAYFARPGAAPLQIAQVAHARTTLPGLPVWTAVRGNQLLLALEGQRLRTIDLESGQIRIRGEEPITVLTGDLSLSPTRPVLAYKLSNRGDGIRLLNLETGIVKRPGQGAQPSSIIQAPGQETQPAPITQAPGHEAHLAPIAWSPTGDQWAVQAAEADSGLPVGVGADLVAGSTHLDLGDLQGGVRHLTPPQRLELVAGPWWSADGRWLAVLTGSIMDLEADRSLWVVDLHDEQWHELGPIPPDAWVSGFARSTWLAGPALMVHTPTDLHLLPADGEEPRSVIPPWQPDPEPIILPGGSLLYLGLEEAPKLYLMPPGADVELLLDEPSPKGHLTVSHRLAALVLYREGPLHDLLLLPLPDLFRSWLP